MHDEVPMGVVIPGRFLGKIRGIAIFGNARLLTRVEKADDVILVM